MPWFLDPKRLREVVSGLTLALLVGIGFIGYKRPVGSRYVLRPVAVPRRRAFRGR